MMTNERPNLYDLPLPDLERLLANWSQPSYRARQLYRQLYVNLSNDLATMTDLPIALRERLAAETRIGAPDLVRLPTADKGLTRKALLRLPGGAVVESVLMVYPDRATACVSTQAGCAMGCVFCATGRLGLLRNLSAGEIVERVLWAAREGEGLRTKGRAEKTAARNNNLSVLSPQPSALTNVVFMGMGEPFANYDRWWSAVERLHDPLGFNMGARSMTVSTVGLAPG